MSTIIISNDMTQPYSEMVTEALHEFSKRRINKIAMVGLSDDATEKMTIYRLHDDGVKHFCELGHNGT